jgi:RNA recognition motif-containing protein
MKKLYVGNLPTTTNDDALRELFASYGEIVSAKVILDRFSGESRGFGFVEFADKAQAEAALALDGSDYNGSKLRVNFARERERTGGGGGGGRKFGGGSGGGRRDDSRSRW